jgi:RNA polymerase sigma factor (sigma-70 family)
MMTVPETLIKRCRKGERKAQFEMYKLCYGFLMAICSRYEKNRDDAEALLNQAFLKILTKLDLFDQEKLPFDAWCRKITINTIIDDFRKQKADRHDFVETLETHVPVSTMDYNEADKKFDAEELENMIRELPTVSQKVFNLYTMDGYSHKEIADMLTITENTSKWHLSFARKSIKSKLLKIMNHVASILI